MLKLTRQNKKVETGQKILAVAFQEFGRRGIMATRMSDIAESAGVSHGTVFVHYQSQEALIIAVIQAFGEKIGRRTHELAVACAGLREVLAAHLQGIQEFEPFYTRLVIESRLLPPQARNTWIGIQSAFSFHISQAVEREINAGKIKSVQVHLFFNTWLGLVNYYVANSDLFAPTGSVIEKYGQDLLDHFMKLVRLHKTD